MDVLASAITEEAILKIPLPIAKKARAISLYLIDGVLTVALATPDDKDLIRRLEQIAEVPISPVFCLPCEIDDAISIHYCTEKTLNDSLAELERDSFFSQPDLATARFEQIAESESLIKVLDEIIYFALRERATDVHIEPQEIQSRIRFRVDGMMREVLHLLRGSSTAPSSPGSRSCAALNIAESRFPQDGRFSLAIGTTKANFRFSSLPTVNGEKVVHPGPRGHRQEVDAHARQDAYLPAHPGPVEADSCRTPVASSS